MADVRDAILRVRRDHRAALSVSVQACLKATPASRYGGRHWFGGALVRTAGRQAKYEDLVGREDRGRAHVVEQDGELCLDTRPAAVDDAREFLGQHGRGQSVTVEDRRDALVCPLRALERRLLAEAKPSARAASKPLITLILTPLLIDLAEFIAHYHTAARSQGPGVRIKIPGFLPSLKASRRSVF